MRVAVRLVRLTSGVVGGDEGVRVIGAAISLVVGIRELRSTEVLGVRVVGCVGLAYVFGAAGADVSLGADRVMLGRLGVIGEAIESRGMLGVTRVGVEYVGVDGV